MSVSDEMATFVRVVEKTGFAAAARDLSLTPSAVSKIVTRLEDRLGTKLLNRTTRRLALTEEGLAYLMRCREILSAIELAEAEIAASGALPRGHIRISAGTAVGRLQIASMLPDFHATYPDITTELRITEQPVDLISDNIDIALRAGKLSDSSLVARKVIESHRLICASPDYLTKHGTPLVPADLMHHNCILISNFPHLARWPFHTPEGTTRMLVRGNVTTDNADVMLDLAISGHGIIRMVDIHLAPSLKRGLLVPLLSEAHADETVPIWAVTPPDRNRVPRVHVFLDFLVRRFRENAPSPRDTDTAH